ncbi:hypothetical protein SDC9_211419 [bioreactor metagenome]|uniref:Uncharacterized protein n=1 Tax=bioreactor metagenome TaxID=1076179 RepID=A0A645JV91_9ZZZZ
MLFQAQFAGHIKQPENAHRRIDQQTPDIHARIGKLALQRTIHADPQVADVAEKVADTGFNRQRHGGIVDLRHRFGSVFIDCFVNREHRTVEPFVRIALVFLGKCIARTCQHQQRPQRPLAPHAHRR